jgi:hypothetical protein
VPLIRDQERSLWLHRAVLANLVADPEQVLSLARANRCTYRTNGGMVRIRFMQHPAMSSWPGITWP